MKWRDFRAIVLYSFSIQRRNEEKYHRIHVASYNIFEEATSDSRLNELRSIIVVRSGYVFVKKGYTSIFERHVWKKFTW